MFAASTFFRRRRNFGVTSCWKKAVVYLEPDFHIDLF